MNETEREEKKFDILLVEDNPGDVLLTKEIFKETAVPCLLHVAKDGVEALHFLRREGAFADAPRINLVLLDLNLPKKDGREVLSEIKSDRILRRIPVIVLTTSEAEQDILQAYDLYANCYISKPASLDEFIAVVKSLERFWLTVVKLPKR